MRLEDLHQDGGQRSSRGVLHQAEGRYVRHVRGGLVGAAAGEGHDLSDGDQLLRGRGFVGEKAVGGALVVHLPEILAFTGRLGTPPFQKRRGVDGQVEAIGLYPVNQARVD